jgi:uncharacterized protein YukE
VSGKTVELGHVPWAHYSHERLWHMVMSADPAALHRRSEHLSTLAHRMGDAGKDVRTTLETLLSTWSGPTAQQVAAVVHPVLKWMAESATTASEIAARLGQYAEAVNQAREDIPYPVYDQQLNAVAADRTVVVPDTPDYALLIEQMAQGKTATSAQAHAAKTRAVQVMHRYERASVHAYSGMPTFTAPPRVPGMTVPPPAPPPHPAPIVPPPHPVGQVGPVDPTAPTGTTTTTSSVTTPSDFAGSTSGAIGATGFSGPGGVAGGLAGSVVGGAAGGAAMAQPGAVSGAGMLAAAEGRLAAMTAAEAGQAGWSGFAPMGANGRPGEQDGEHRDRYAGRSDIVGDLPPAFPPVLGL